MGQEIIDGNKLIAEFMGMKEKLDFQLPKTDEGGYYPINKKGEYDLTEYFTPYSHLDYHSSWDWLMPVVEKIETLTAFDGRGEVNYIVSIEANQCIISQGGEGEIEYEQSEAKIGATWKAVVQFINWYNTQPKGGE